MQAYACSNSFTNTRRTAQTLWWRTNFTRNCRYNVSGLYLPNRILCRHVSQTTIARGTKKASQATATSEAIAPSLMQFLRSPKDILERVQKSASGTPSENFVSHGDAEALHVQNYKPFSTLESRFIHPSDMKMLQQYRIPMLKHDMEVRQLAADSYGLASDVWITAVDQFVDIIKHEPKQLFPTTDALQMFFARCNFAEEVATREHLTDIVPLVAQSLRSIAMYECSSTDSHVHTNEEHEMKQIRSAQTSSENSSKDIYPSKSRLPGDGKDFVDPSDQAIMLRRIRPLYDNTDAMKLATKKYGLNSQLWVRGVARLRRALMTSPSVIFDGVVVDSEVANGTSDLKTRPERDPISIEMAKLEAKQTARGNSEIFEEGELSPRPFCRQVDEGLRAFNIFLTRCSHQDETLAKSHTHDIVPLVARATELYFPSEIAMIRKLRASADLRLPQHWYPAALAMKRKIIYHAGPTNSGKTHAALQRLLRADSGIYAGPLRLLALEIYEKLNLEGKYASLLTGQERREMPFSTHTASTVEMVNLKVPVDVAVVDEIQLIGDPYRGHSWTRAIMGIQAAEIHVCGDASAIPAVQKLCEITNDTFELHEYSRLSSLQVSSESLSGDYSNIQKGDCVVAFSRRDIYSIRRIIERKTSFKCCVVYGNLPPETRSAQARLFNDPNSEYDVLVASDAVGMGLNLNIKRIVFHTLEKFDGDSVGPVAPSAVKQIAGRAGRHGTQYDSGEVTTLLQEDLSYLHECMACEISALTHSGLFPTGEQLEAFARMMPQGCETPLAALIETFIEVSQMDGAYFMCRHDDVLTAARIVDAICGLTVTEKFTLCCAPAPLRNREVRVAFEKYANAIANKAQVPMLVQLPINYSIKGLSDMELLESRHLVADLYIWLGYRFPASFPQVDKAVEAKSKAIAMIEEGLASLASASFDRSVRQRVNRLAKERARKLRAREKLQYAVQNRKRLGVTKSKYNDSHSS